MSKPTASLSDLLGGLSAEAAQAIEAALIRAISTGESVVSIAKTVMQSLQTSLFRALTVARNVIMDGFRGTVSTVLQANSDTVAGWIWVANIGGSPMPCFPVGTMVQTEYGEKPIEQVEVGEKVLTHTGQYKRVVETHKRAYEGELYTFCTEDAYSKVTATSEHPFLVERQRKLDWIEARNIRLRDHVIRQFQGGSEIGDHGVGSGAIERHIRQSNDAISSRLQPERLLDIAFFDMSGRMPVLAINLKARIERWQKEINGIMPTWERIFLLILNTQRLETQPRSALRFSLTGIPSVTTHTTEKPVALHDSGNTELFSAVPAIHDNRGASAFLRAKFPILAALKDFTAPLTSMGIRLNDSNRFWLVSFPYVEALKRTEFLITLRRWYCEDLTAIQAGYDGVMGNTAFLATVFSRATGDAAKLFPAPFTGTMKKRLSLLATSGMRMFTLVKSITSPRAETSVAPLYPGVGDGKDFIALSTRHFHTSIITHIATHIQHIPVYNLGVEDDNSYVANGYVVHNCIACILMHGTKHPLSEIMQSHVNCHCQMVAYFADNPDIAGESGLDWFLQQDAETQQGILGMAKWTAWKRGKVSLQDLVGIHHSSEYGNSIYVKSLKQLGVR